MLLLDTLKIDNIDTIIEIRNGITDPEVRKAIAKIVYKRTSGVPRLVAYATEYLKKNNVGPLTKKEDITFFGKEFLDYLRKEQKARHELNPTLKLPDERIPFYKRLIGLAAFRIPLDTEATVNPEEWGLPADTRGQYQKIPLLDIIHLYNLYIEKGTDGWRILFPEVVLDELALKSEKTDNSLLFWVSLYKTFAKRVFDAAPGPLLEEMAARCITLNLSYTLGVAKRDSTWAGRYSFLKGSLLGTEKISISPSHPIHGMNKDNINLPVTRFC